MPKKLTVRTQRDVLPQEQSTNQLNLRSGSMVLIRAHGRATACRFAQASAFEVDLALLPDLTELGFPIKSHHLQGTLHVYRHHRRWRTWL